MSYTFSHTFVTQALPDTIYDYLTNLRAYPEWSFPDIVEIPTDGPMEVGTKWRSTSSGELGDTGSEESETVSLIPGRLIRLTTVSKAHGTEAVLDCTYTLSPKVGGTQVTYREDLVPDRNGFLGSGWRVGGWAGGRLVIIKYRIERLRKALEASQGVYETSLRTSLLFVGLLSLAVGTPFLAISVLYALGLIAVNGHWIGEEGASWGFLLWAVPAGLVCLSFARRLLLQQAFQVRIDSDGALTFRTVSRTMRISASEIVRINAVVARFSLEGEDARQVWITHQHGRVMLPYSHQVETILSRLTTLNPTISVVRTW